LGDPSLLEPGQNVILATAITAERIMRTQTRITAEAIKEETGEIIAGRTVTTTETFSIFVEDAGGLPGFGDSLGASWDVPKGLGGVAIVVMGAVIPFIWLVPLAVLFAI
jgi:hypothetical protein